MRMIVGGAYQGKRAYAVHNYGIREDEITDGAVLPLEKLCARPEEGGTGAGRFQCISNFHLVIKRLLEEGRDPMEVLQRFLAENTEVVIIMDEVGNGIIPLERSERIRREQVGRCGCFLAARAECVDRVVCGLAVRIK